MKVAYRASLIFVSSIFATMAMAQSVETNVTASNGVVISKISDDFAGRHEYSAPAIEVRSAKGASVIAIPAKVRKGSALGEFSVVGFVMYNGDWRYYDSAVFRGGDPVDYTRTDSKVGSCRYGCTLTESFSIRLTPAQIAKHSEGGNIVVQIRSRSLDTAQISIPVSYIDAVNELAK